MPQLWGYTQYIGGSKTDVEIVDSIVGKFDTAFDEVKNSLIVADLLDLTNKDRKYLLEFVELIKGLRGEVESVRSNRRQAQNDAVARSKDILNNASLSSSDVEFMAKGQQPQKIKYLNRTIAQMVLAVNKRNVETLSKVKEKICNTHIRDVEKAIQTAQETITQKTDEVKEKITNATAKSIIESFKTPTFPPAIDRLMSEFQRIDAGVDNGLLSGVAKGSHRVEY